MGDRAGSDMALHLNEAGQSLLALVEATEREQSGTMTVGLDYPSMFHSPHQAPALVLFAPALFHSGAKVLMLGGVRENIGRIQNQAGSNLQSFSSSTLDQPCP